MADNSSTKSYLKRLVLDLGDDYLQKWNKGRDLNILSLTELAMAVAENVSKAQNLSGAEKLEMAKDLLPSIIEVLKEKNIVEADKADDLLKKISESQELINQFIPIAVEIAQNPAVIQTASAIVDLAQDFGSSKCGCLPCCRKSKKK